MGRCLHWHPAAAGRGPRHKKVSQLEGRAPRARPGPFYCDSLSPSPPLSSPRWHRSVNTCRPGIRVTTVFKFYDFKRHWHHKKTRPATVTGPARLENQTSLWQQLQYFKSPTSQATSLEGRPPYPSESLGSRSHRVDLPQEASSPSPLPPHPNGCLGLSL